MKRIVILGSTGSIGKNALQVVKANPDKYKVVGLSANRNIDLAAFQAKEFGVKNVAIYDLSGAAHLRSKLPGTVKVFSGIDGISEVATIREADMVLMAIGGTVSVVPLVKAIKAGKDIALASKEAMVSAGCIVTKLAKKHNVKIMPVDSEHSAIFQCLEGHAGGIKKIYLTGTGGPLRTVKKHMFDKLPVSRVIDHPKWKMGRKITVDSATLMNKGLEMIEARWLFDVSMDMIDVVIHPEAIIHSMVEFADGVVMASLFYPDMKIPIAYAFSYPDRTVNEMPRLDFVKLGSLSFEKPDVKRFPALELAYEAGKCQSHSCVLNAANEEAVHLFLEGKIKFTSIIEIVSKVLQGHKRISEPSLENILALDAWAKDEVKKFSQG